VSVHQLFDMTWSEVADLGGPRTVAIVPVGAIEAHGPHLPLATDVIIAEAMVSAGPRRLSEAGYEVLVFPALTYTPAGFSAAFEGTVNVSEFAFAETLVSIGASLVANGIGTLAIANVHFDPENLAGIREAISAMPEGLDCRFPDLTRKPWALRMGDEFKSGACHGGRYETSIVLAERPELVKQDVQRALRPVEVSLSDAMRTGKRSFLEAGIEQAYCGSPADATAEEGRRTVSILGEVLFDSVVTE
jgi:creatinine amidohydrolase